MLEPLPRLPGGGLVQDGYLRNGPRTSLGDEHHVGISEFHACVELACERGPELELQDWRQDQEAHGKCAWKLPRRTEEQRRIHEKLERYGWYRTHPNYRGKYPRSEDVRVLIVTTSPVRMKNMMGMLQNLMDGLDYEGRPCERAGTAAHAHPAPR